MPATIAALLGTLFVDPIDVSGFWPWLLIPLAVGIALIYKTIKSRHVRSVPLSAAALTLVIVAGMAAAAGALFVIYTVASHWKA